MQAPLRVHRAARNSASRQARAGDASIYAAIAVILQIFRGCVYNNSIMELL